VEEIKENGAALVAHFFGTQRLIEEEEINAA
jgi:hypothetical protein